MPIIDDIKCPRCDRKYSGVRSRCPYCGARRVGFGKYSKDGDNAKGKMLISILILAVFTVAAGILLFSTPAAPEAEVEATPDISLEDELLRLQSLETPPPTPTPTPEPTPPPVEFIQILWGGLPPYFHPNITAEFREDSNYSVRVEPITFDGEIEFTIEPEGVFTVEPVHGGRAHGFKVIIADDANRNDFARLTVTAGGLSDYVIISVGNLR